MHKPNVSVLATNSFVCWLPKCSAGGFDVPYFSTVIALGRFEAAISRGVVAFPAAVTCGG